MSDVNKVISEYSDSILDYIEKISKNIKGNIEYIEELSDGVYDVELKIFNLDNNSVKILDRNNNENYFMGYRD